VIPFYPAALYSPHGQMFICRSLEQFDVLTANGWTDKPLEFPKPYAHEKAEWVENWDDLRLKRKK
jgi:hypothetical protein